MPKASSTYPAVSNRSGLGTRRSGMKRVVATKPIRPTGKLMRNTQCHDALCTSQPPSVGPSSGPMSPGMATKLIASRNSPRGKVRSTARRPTGSSSAPPRPCSTRAASSSFRWRELAHAREPSENTAMAKRNTLRVPKRSASQPEAGINMAMVNEYATITDCICSGLSPRLAAIAGRAVLTMVASSVCMKNPTATIHSRMRRWSGPRAEAGTMGVASGLGDAMASGSCGNEKAALGGGWTGGTGGNQVEKLEPHPQVVVALGFLMTNCAPCRSSL